MKSLRLKLYLFLAIVSIFTETTASQNEYSLYQVLDAYGFPDIQQKEALKDLFKQAEIIPSNSSWEEVFPTRKSEDELVPDILKMIEETQEKLWIRKNSQETKTQERWETKPLEWMELNKEKTLLNLEKLGLVKEIRPTIKNTDAICILGSTRTSMEGRIQYAETLIKEGLITKNIILLAGERYVTEGIDGTQNELMEIASKLQVSDWEELTETQLITNSYESSELAQRKLPHHVIDTPSGELPRPTTQTTIMELISWLKEHQDIQDIIFISEQPYVKYQSAIINSIFESQNVHIRIEIVGSYSHLPIGTKEIIEGLGSYLWAVTPILLSRMNITTEDPKIKQSFKKLYAENPLIYNILPKSLRECEN